MKDGMTGLYEIWSALEVQGAIFLKLKYEEKENYNHYCVASICSSLSVIFQRMI